MHRGCGAWKNRGGAFDGRADEAWRPKTPETRLRKGRRVNLDPNMPARTEYCWRCCGRGEVMAIGGGYHRCYECNGTGYGESMETYWKRNGIVPDFKRAKTKGSK